MLSAGTVKRLCKFSPLEKLSGYAASKRIAVKDDVGQCTLLGVCGTLRSLQTSVRSI